MRTMLGLVSLIAVLSSMAVLCNACCFKDENMMNRIVARYEGKLSFQSPIGGYTEEAPLYAINILLPKNDAFLAEDIPTRQLISIDAYDRYTIKSFWVKDNRIVSAHYRSPKDAAVSDWKKWLKEEKFKKFASLRRSDLEKVTPAGCEEHWGEMAGGLIGKRVGFDSKCVTTVFGIKNAEATLKCTIYKVRQDCNFELAFQRGLIKA